MRDTPALQYNLELGIAGYEDRATASPNSVVQRVEGLRSVQRAWCNPHPRLVHSISVPSKAWFEARWFKDVLAGRMPGDIRKLDVFYLGAAVKDADRLRSLQFDVDFDATCIDPGQDLVVLTCSVFGPNYGSELLPSVQLTGRS